MHISKSHPILFKFKASYKFIVTAIILCFSRFDLIETQREIINIDDWGNLWHTASVHAREKMLIDFFQYAFEPVAPNRHHVLARLKQLQRIVNTSPWDIKDFEIKKAIEKNVNDEVILTDAAIGMNLPEWCGTIPSRHLTGDNIAFLCSHRTFKVNGYSSVFVPFDPQQVKAGDSVFVVTNYLDLFFDVYHKEIPHPYILVTDNSDFPVPSKFGHFLDDEKILAWFCINPDGTKHSKLHPIPLGIRNHGYGCEMPDFMDKIIMSCRGLAKKNLLYVNFTDHNQERHDALRALRNKRWCTFASNRNQPDFYKDVAQSKFVLSPRGDGLDCWRTWETLLLGSFPIVKHSPLDDLFAEFPVVIVQDWSEITEEFLKNKYEEFSKNTYNYDKLFAAYWGDRINDLNKNSCD